MVGIFDVFSKGLKQITQSDIIKTEDEMNTYLEEQRKIIQEKKTQFHEMAKSMKNLPKEDFFKKQAEAAELMNEIAGIKQDIINKQLEFVEYKRAWERDRPENQVKNLFTTPSGKDFLVD